MYLNLWPALLALVILPRGGAAEGVKHETEEIESRSGGCHTPPCKRLSLFLPNGARPGSPCTQPPCELLALPKFNTQLRPASAAQRPPPLPSPAAMHASYVERFQSECGKKDVQKILGGRRARKGEWTWTVALMRPNRGGPWQAFCGGTLISDRHVLTAAHCVHRMKSEDLRIRSGDVDLDAINESDDIKVSDIIVHSDYNAQNLSSDIAIVKLDRAIQESDQISFCCLPTTRNLVGKTGVALGWGATDASGAVASTSKHLLHVNLPIITNALCRRRLHRTIIDSMLCAGGIRGRDSCSGDSGGPFVVHDVTSKRWYVEGVVSFGPKPCGAPNMPGVYSRVASFRDWVIEHAV